VLHKYRAVCRAAEIIDRGPYTRFPKTLYADRRASVTTAGSGRTRTSRPQSIADRVESTSPPPPGVYAHSETTHQNERDQISRTSRYETDTPEGIDSRARPPGTSVGPSFSSYEDADLHSFVDRFRRMVHQAARDTEDGGLALSSPEGSDDNGQVYLEGDQREFNPYVEGNLLYHGNGSPIEVSVDPSQVQVFGRMVHRMPTITSIGSGERSSRAPSRAYSGHPSPGERSLPSSRSNTVENDVAGQPHSRPGVY
jgi:hypothetical protein